MEESVNDDASPMSIHDAINESHPDMETGSTEQLEDTTEATDKTTEATDESTKTEKEEISNTEDSTEETESTEEATEETSTDSDIVDLTGNNESETTEENDSEAKAETNGINFGEILGGQFEDAEDLETHLVELQEKIEELEEAQKTPEFANEYVEKLNAHVLAGGSAEKFTRVQGVNVDNMNAVEILTIGLMWDNPDFSEKDAKALLESKFENALDEDGNLDASSPILREAANKAAKAIKDIQAEDKLVPQAGVSEEEWNQKTEAQKAEAIESQEAADTERMEAWMQPVEDELNNLKENGIVIPMTDKKGFKFPFKMDAKYEEGLMERVDQALYNAGTSIKDNPKAAKELMTTLFKMDNFDAIVKASSLRGANSVNEEWFKKVQNPSAISKGDEKTSSTSTPSAEEQMNRIWSE